MRPQKTFWFLHAWNFQQFRIKNKIFSPQSQQHSCKLVCLLFLLFYGKKKSFFSSEEIEVRGRKRAKSWCASNLLISLACGVKKWWWRGRRRKWGEVNKCKVNEPQTNSHTFLAHHRPAFLRSSSLSLSLRRSLAEFLRKAKLFTYTWRRERDRVTSKNSLMNGIRPQHNNNYCGSFWGAVKNWRKNFTAVKNNFSCLECWWGNETSE